MRHKSLQLLTLRATIGTRNRTSAAAYYMMITHALLKAQARLEMAHALASRMFSDWHPIAYSRQIDRTPSMTSYTSHPLPAAPVLIIFRYLSLRICILLFQLRPLMSRPRYWKCRTLILMLTEHLLRLPVCLHSRSHALRSSWDWQWNLHWSQPGHGYHECHCSNVSSLLAPSPQSAC